MLWTPSDNGSWWYGLRWQALAVRPRRPGSGSLPSRLAPGWARLAVAALCIGLSGSVVSGQTQVPPVVVVPVERRPVPVTLALVGSVLPTTRSVIASELTGLVEELAVEEGDRVDQGAVLCRLRDTTRRLLHEQAKAQLGQFKAELEELEAGTRKEEIDQARAEMEEAKALHEKWRRELERIKRLRDQGSASMKEYNDTVSDTTAARQRLAQAKATYELAEAGPRKEKIARARFAVEAQRALLAKLEYDLDQTVIRAPFAGYVTEKRTEVGQWLDAGGPVVELIDLETVLIRVDVPESAIGAAKVGEEVSVVVDALGATFRARIAHVIPQANEKARTFPVEIALPNPGRRLKSGMFVRARVPAGPTQESLVVPRDAVLHRQDSDVVVMVVPSPAGEGQMGMPVPVELGAEMDDWIAVRSPMLREGVPVAVKGHNRIYGPQPVAPIPTGKSPATQPGPADPGRREASGRVGSAAS